MANLLLSVVRFQCLVVIVVEARSRRGVERLLGKPAGALSQVDFGIVGALLARHRFDVGLESLRRTVLSQTEHTCSPLFGLRTLLAALGGLGQLGFRDTRTLGGHETTVSGRTSPAEPCDSKRQL